MRILLQRGPVAKKVYRILFFAVAYLLLPWVLLATGHIRSWFMVAAFHLVNLCVLIALYTWFSSRREQINLKLLDIDEQINITNNHTAQAFKAKLAAQHKITRYGLLRTFVENISSDLTLDSVCETICETAFSLISNKQGTCLLYLVDPHHQLSLFQSRKQDPTLVVKEKQGDIFDWWVVRHVGPLLVEDTRKDFRFDIDKTGQKRTVSSLAVAPLISENKLIGVLRLEHAMPQTFNQEDLRFLVALADVAAVAVENSQMYQRTKDLATHDGLTNLLNRRFFYEQLQEECARSHRANNTCCVLMADIDHFKQYNDKFGHTAGDIVLKHLAALMTHTFKDYETVLSRFGGEEFCILLKSVTRDEGLKAARLFRAAVEKSNIVLRRQETSVTISIGLAMHPEDGAQPDELLMKADQALYSAKQQGRNKVVACSG